MYDIGVHIYAYKCICIYEKSSALRSASAASSHPSRMAASRASKHDVAILEFTVWFETFWSTDALCIPLCTGVRDPLAYLCEDELSASRGPILFRGLAFKGAVLGYLGG